MDVEAGENDIGGGRAVRVLDGHFADRKAKGSAGRSHRDSAEADPG